MWFSLTTGNFYFPDSNYGALLPNDLIDVTPAERHAALTRRKDEALDVVDGKLVVVPFSDERKMLMARAEQFRLVDQSCKDAIVAGFSSAALGMVCNYPSKPEDQTNLIAAVTASQSAALPADWVVLFLCSDSNGLWDYRLHTAAQIQQVLADGVAQRIAYSQKIARLVAEINQAESPLEVQTIVW